MNVLKTKFGTARPNTKGYYQIQTKPEGNLNRLLHRLIWEDFYGCKIPEGYIVHHKNGNKQDNCILNLQLMRSDVHNRYHMLGEDNPMRGKKLSLEERLNISRHHNKSGVYKVYKHYDGKYKQGFTWRYVYSENGKQKTINSVDFEKLREKVLEKGFEWRELDC